MRPIEFTLVQAEKSNVKITVDGERIETIVEGSVMNNPDVTQLAMSSGRTFFVAHPYKEVLVKIYGTT